jgi:predicted nucleic acid-binding protein
MEKAFVDTTILVDALLKAGEDCAKAKTALQRFAVTELPVYAIKEFQQGALRHFIWFHNKLQQQKSFIKAIRALQRMSLTPRRYTTATAIEALHVAANAGSRADLKDLVEKYGHQANLDRILCDRYRLALRYRISHAWNRRRNLTTRVVGPLACFPELGPKSDRSGLLVMEFSRCRPAPECSLAGALRQNPDALDKLRLAVQRQPQGRENESRSGALKAALRGELNERACRQLGDAIFAFFCPKDSTILTTNIRDHLPLAAALGKSVQSP